MKKLTLLLSILLLFLILPTEALAVGEDVTEAICTVSDLSPLEEALYHGMMATEESIDISSFGVTKPEVVAAMQHLSDSVPELFHVSRTYNYSTTTVVPVYLLEGDALEAARAEYLFALDIIAEGVDPTWSDEMICLYLHDYLCQNFAYDTAYEIFDAYGFLTRGRGVCQSYTLVYTALLSRFDIPVTYATGTDGAVDHIWNIVKIDGEYYHVDVTWGDALSGGGDCFARATHENFLKSDAAIDATGHGSRKNHGGIICSSTRYDESAINGADTAAALLDGRIYAIVDGEVLLFENGLGATPASVYTITEEWQSGTQYLVNKPAGLVAYGGTLYVNTPKSIKSLDPASGYTEVLVSVANGMILTIRNEGSTLYYRTAADISGRNELILTATLPSALPPCTGEHAYTVYATIPATCTVIGTSYQKCTACGHKTTEDIPTLPHSTVATVIPPDYGTAGYTEHVCTACGATERTDQTDALPLPTVSDYRTALAAAENAATAGERLAAIGAALAMEPHLDPDAITAEYAALRALMNAYEVSAAAANTAHAEKATLLIFTDFSFFTGAGTVMLLFFLAIRRIFGL